jgi:arylsulfatase A-like enzyme
VALALAACARAPAPPRPRLVVLYATCSLSKEFLAPYDARVTYTPALAALARESVVFERHVTEAAVSGIAYASLFTGAQADRHGIFHHPSRLSAHLLTIFEAFAAAGYETHYWNGHPMAGADLDYAQGVAPEHVYPPAGHAGNDKSFARSLLQRDDPWFQRLLERLRRDPDLRALVVANFTVTHAPYTRQVKPAATRAFLETHPAAARGVPADELARDLERLAPVYEEHRLPLQWDYPTAVARLGLSAQDEAALARALEAQYAAGVGLLDALLAGTLATLEESGLDGETLFAFTADHGEYLFQRERPFQWGHGLQLAPEELCVPWLLRSARGSFAPGRYAEVTRSIDVFPTLAGLCGVELPEGAPVDGIDLSPALLGRAPPPAQLGPAHTKVLDERLMREFEDLALVRRYYPSTDPDLLWVAVREGDRFARWRNRGDGTFVHELFELGHDPRALRDVFDARDPEHARLARWLEEYKARLVSAYGSERGVEAQEIDADLRALGYVR